MKEAAATIHFKATLYTLKEWTILSIPESESMKLPSRGQVSVSGLMNGHEFKTVLEPDGRWSHWMRINENMQTMIQAKAGDTVTVQITPAKKWPEPAIPTDFAEALAEAPRDIHRIWSDITPMARWEWVRWVNSTGSTETREKRINASISKMDRGKRRPCCFNLAACTEPYLSKSGRLIEPSGK